MPSSVESVSVYVPWIGDPRDQPPAPEGLTVHYGPPLHADDLDVVNGLPCTSVSRTLCDMAEVLPIEELWACFARAAQMGVLDMAAVEASYARLEWRPSLGMLRDVIDAFQG